MQSTRFVLTVLVVGSIGTSRLHAGDSAPSADDVRKAITKSIPLLEKGTAGSADERTCFTCHNQAVPVFALAEVRKRGFKIDAANLQRQLEHTADHLKRGRKTYLEGKGQGGRVVTAGYALWTLEAGEWEADEITTAVTGYLLEYQKQANHWQHRGSRPPSSGSDWTTTYVALRGLAAFGSQEQQSKIDARIQTVRKWILDSRPKDTEDRVFRLRSFKYFDADGGTVRKAVAELVDAQRSDGGWAQKSDMESDAYATSTVLATLLDDDHLPADHRVIRRGVQYLIDSQLDDGSWHVATRAKPFQTYFETGYPHRKDQFISITASGWATLALSLTLPEVP